MFFINYVYGNFTYYEKVHKGKTKRENITIVEMFSLALATYYRINFSDIFVTRMRYNLITFDCDIPRYLGAI